MTPNPEFTPYDASRDPRSLAHIHPDVLAGQGIFFDRGLSQWAIEAAATEPTSNSGLQHTPLPPAIEQSPNDHLLTGIKVSFEVGPLVAPQFLAAIMAHAQQPPNGRQGRPSMPYPPGYPPQRPPYAPTGRYPGGQPQLGYRAPGPNTYSAPPQRQQRDPQRAGWAIGRLLSGIAGGLMGKPRAGRRLPAATKPTVHLKQSSPEEGNNPYLP